MKRIYAALLLASVFIISLLLNLTAATLRTGAAENEYLSPIKVVPEPEGGMASIINEISYPKYAINESVSTRVNVLTYIDDNGVINCAEDIIVFRGG